MKNSLRYLLFGLGVGLAIALVPRLPVLHSPDMVMAQGTSQTISPQGLANHLKKINAKMYGAYWCPACMKQKELFGSAFKSINYIECDARGTNGQPELCKQANIRAYPTWEINGKRYEGVYPLEGLAQLSGYQGR
ncbi:MULTISPECIES: hypothetical protein [unclassified Thermosynechococcus]|uniref:hypothetical protein n=1 Tax=unclassified Thermosynechococcus TaxID=2622553 RepID=UPI00122E04BF|nr:MULTISPECIES: hypothetical protein [unclassified Thermosynechococcus]MDR5640066.1 hypothetical protein [Thermosynechococcus sp. PP42]MDR7922371.1 hypothetical protein [Thermosynechococcus sp. HY213]QEQ01259.1 hypothetical protein FFX45_07625 [Thermosynechococcus sp. CL-1]QSF48977.1 hypothetical protein JW907_11710 [Thermosynechococcus sp. TA-1]WJI23099.1 hypothetical protein MZ909_07640 [Thermosynechococcus sp. B0]